MLELRAEKLQAEAEVARGVAATALFDDKTRQDCRHCHESYVAIQAAVLSEMGGFLGHLEREPSPEIAMMCEKHVQ